jgi:hypothetical protein
MKSKLEALADILFFVALAAPVVYIFGRAIAALIA